MKGRIWTVPNQITFLRLCFLPFFLIFMSYEKYKWAVIILASGYRPFPPSIYGKFTTFSQIVLVFAVVLGAAYPAFHLDLLNRFLVYFVSALSVISGVHYSFTVARRLNLPSQPL